MPDEVLIKTCSPTLAGLKTGSIFNLRFATVAEVFDTVRRWNRLLCSKGLRFLPLRYTNQTALIYVYRPSALKNDLSRLSACRLLIERGYCTESCDMCVSRLFKRLREEREFPHEIGLFLGYPPEDVRGFIENNAGGYKVIGCWKVYGDEEAAEKYFNKCKKCTDVYCKQYADGKPIEKLAVSI